MPLAPALPFPYTPPYPALPPDDHEEDRLGEP